MFSRVYSYPAGTRSDGEIAGKTALSEKPGAQTGANSFDCELQGQWKLRGIVELNQALASLNTWQAACQTSKAQAAVSAIAEDLRAILERCERMR